jgi:hypothetical protein
MLAASAAVAPAMLAMQATLREIAAKQAAGVPLTP